jgi:hypothetical protein
MKKFGRTMFIVFLLMALATQAFAWEFKMKGDTEWRYRYWTRTGTDDIFGHMDGRVVLGINHLQTFPTSATTNHGTSTFGVIAGEDRFGADMQRTDYRTTLYPTIEVNKAIAVTASVNLTSLGIWSDGRPLVANGLATTTTNPGYANSLYVPIQDRPVNIDVPNTYVTLQYLKLGIKTPWVDFSIGYKDSKIGMGLWKHGFNRASSSFGMTAHYGPFKFAFSPYFGRELSSWAVGTNGSRIEGAGAPQRVEDRRNYFQAVFGEMEYSNGPLVFTLVSDSYRQPSAQSPTRRLAAISTTQIPSDDILRYRIAMATKYNNGRFFFNAEADWFNRWRSGRGTAASTTLVNQNEDDQGWLYGVEFGAIAGPSKVTLNYVRATGDDPSTRFTSEDAATAESGLSAGYMKDWAYLMYYMYGAGDGWDAAGYGQPTNMHHVGGRLDYAIASNLNFFGVYAYAWRDQPNAYTLGGDGIGGIRPFTNNDIRVPNANIRAVPDHAREIGWEVDGGFNWKILENLTWNTTLAYWKPGAWWSYAYPDTAAIYRANGLGAIAAANYPVAVSTAGRKIDPLFAVETTLLVNF